VAFDPDGTTMATGADDGTARLWTVATGTARRTFQGDGTAVTDLAFGPGGDGLIALTAEAPR
jgi:WD40 repeat protein